MQETNEKKSPLWARWIFSDFVLSLSKSKQIAFTALGMAIAIVANTFLEVKLGGVQYSLTIFTSVLVGIMFGALPGFAACFFGDLIGFILHPMGEYSPFIGISTGLMAVFGAWFICRSLWTFKGAWLINLSLTCLAIFVVCTAGINNWYLNAVWYKSLTFFECLATRLIVQGQLWNSLVNYALLFIALPVLVKIKPLKIKIA